MRKEREEKLLKLWKIRQENDGVNVSMVKTLKEAEHFYDNQEKMETTNEDGTLSYNELQRIGKELGIRTVGISKENLIKAIEEAQAENKSIEDVVVDIVNEG